MLDDPSGRDTRDARWNEWLALAHGLLDTRGMLRGCRVGVQAEHPQLARIAAALRGAEIDLAAGEDWVHARLAVVFVGRDDGDSVRRFR